jgi:4-hydroxybenzoate polyprenyltransferase
LFDYRDRDDDKADGVRSLITFLSDRHIQMLFYSSFAVFAICTIALYYYGFSWLVIGVLLLPGIVVAFSYNKATRTFADLYYYFFLDGMMAASALLMLVARI